ncbi:MAG: pyrroline-5-carboxylate reductase [Phycisphaera sp.]|nr:pyrroline-5-carboxylate reductase [Phycisphaera sp.]
MNKPAPESAESALSLAVIGAGNMGGTVLRAMLASGIVKAEQVGICDPDEERAIEFMTLGCRRLDLVAAGRTGRILLAVKPQILAKIAGEIGPGDGPRLVISVMAGFRSTRILDALRGDTRIVRAMPNTPAAIGAGVTAISPGDGAMESDLAFARSLFASVGTTVDIDEDHLHAVTAVSGSGPAWVFRKAEAWISAAITEGLPPDVARILVVETLYGAALLLRESELDAGALRAAVTSKGGTTAAGLTALDEAGFDQAVHGAIRAAVARGHELDSNDT